MPAVPAALGNTGLDAIQKVQKIGLQVHLVIRRRDAVDAVSTILAGQSIGLHHPIQIDDVVERAQRRPPFRPRQTGYPLSVRGQVRGVQVPSHVSGQRFSSLGRPLPLARVPVSPVPRGQRSNEGATTSRLRIPGRLSVSLPWSARSSALRARLGGAPGWLEYPSGPGHLVSRPPICRHSLSRTQAGSHRFPGDPSHAFAPVQDPAVPTILTLTVSSMLPPSTHSEGSGDDNFEATHSLLHLLPTLHDGRRRTPCKVRFRLVG